MSQDNALMEGCIGFFGAVGMGLDIDGVWRHMDSFFSPPHFWEFYTSVGVCQTSTLLGVKNLG